MYIYVYICIVLCYIISNIKRFLGYRGWRWTLQLEPETIAILTTGSTQASNPMTSPTPSLQPDFDLGPLYKERPAHIWKYARLQELKIFLEGEILAGRFQPELPFGPDI